MLEASSVRSPSAVATATCVASTRRALPITSSTPWFLSRPATPPVSLATMPAFHSTSLVTSSFTPSAVMPMAEAWPILCIRLPAAISALDGMQPTFRQVPPTNSFSTTTTCWPSWARRMAQT